MQIKLLRNVYEHSCPKRVQCTQYIDHSISHEGYRLEINEFTDVKRNHSHEFRINHKIRWTCVNDSIFRVVRNVITMDRVWFAAYGVSVSELWFPDILGFGIHQSKLKPENIALYHENIAVSCHSQGEFPSITDFWKTKKSYLWPTKWSNLSYENTQMMCDKN